MKRPIIGLLILSGLFLMTSCSDKAGSQTVGASAAVDTPDETVKLEAWDKLKEDYHDVMSTTFHPAEEGNLAPVREKYKELADKASLWSAAPLPAKYMEAGMAEKLSALSNQATDLAALIEADPENDEEIKQALFALHDQFHTIVEACRDQ